MEEIQKSYNKRNNIHDYKHRIQLRSHCLHHLGLLSGIALLKNVIDTHSHYAQKYNNSNSFTAHIT